LTIFYQANERKTSFAYGKAKKVYKTIRVLKIKAVKFLMLKKAQKSFIFC